MAARAALPWTRRSGGLSRYVRPPIPRARCHPVPLPRRGQAVFEFLLVFPVFIAFLLLAVDFGVWMFANVAIANATREGARFAAVRCTASTCSDGTSIKTRVTSRSSNIVKSESEVLVRWSNTDSVNPVGTPNKPGRGDRYIVQVSHLHRFLFLPGAPPVTIVSCADMRLESDDVNSTIVRDDAFTC